MAQLPHGSDPTDPTLPDAGGAMARLVQALGTQQAGKPEVERWNPPFCGHIDMKIAADGTWLYNGSAIRRMPLVKLFASVLRREPIPNPDGLDFVLVTPVEKLGITVEDAPFQAVEMAVEGMGEERSIAFRTNVDDLVNVGPGHALKFIVATDGALKPYIHVRRNLWARVSRALTHDLVALCEVQGDMFGVFAGGMFHVVMPATGAGVQPVGDLM
jgi:uncharacterized protein